MADYRTKMNAQGLYGLGARRIGVTSLPPMGCLPASVTLFGGGNTGCVERLNNDSLTFNRKLGVAADAVKRRHSDLKLVVFDIYQPLLDLVNNPTNAGTDGRSRALPMLCSPPYSFLGKGEGE